MNDTTTNDDDDDDDNNNNKHMATFLYASTAFFVFSYLLWRSENAASTLCMSSIACQRAKYILSVIDILCKDLTS